ncbi:MAG TPA: cell division protein FtsZ [Verrucomicrobiae bacterium]|nr:cell division protein FtsZ [Verrucomicrobiae bacterium]
MNTLPANSRLTVKIIGLGGAGGNVVQQLQGTDLAVLPALIAHTNPRVLADLSHPTKLLLGEGRTRGLGAGGDPELGRQAAEDVRAAIADFCKDADLVFVVAGLGGGTGGGAAPVISKIAREAGCLVLGLAAMPFDFEGVRRREQAKSSMREFRAAADAVITLPNQRMTAIFDQNTPMREAFKLTNNLLAQGIRGIWQMLARPGLVNVDFAYLYSIVRGKNAESAFASAEAAGEMRARDVVEKLVGSPLLDEGQVLAQSTDILVSIVGGADMTIADVNKVMEQLQRRAESANLIMGAAIDDTYEGRLCLTVVATRHSHEPASDKTSTPRATKPAAPAKEQKESDFETNFLSASSTPRGHSRYSAPPPASTPENTAELLNRQTGKTRRTTAKAKQQTLNLEIVSKGRFEKSEPTIHRGEDLDVPTYVRRGVALN